MNRAVIPLAAVATFVAVYQLTPAPSPAAPAPGPAPAAVRAPESIAGPAVRRPVAVEAPGRKSGRRESRRRRVAGPAVRPAARPPRAVAPAPPAAAVHYPGCNAVRAAGLAPLYRGQPGYRADMDGDGDGIACEPHRRR